jgi:mono/diheme cytochrome c family protein
MAAAPQWASAAVTAPADARNQRRVVGIDAYTNGMTRLAFLSCVCFLTIMSIGADAQWGAGWAIPAGAEKEVSPVKASPAVLKEGKSIFDARCARCHGAEGKGDGKESDPNNPAADLTDSFRADLNPDGVMFHRVAGGKPPAMPAFKGQLTPQEIWTVVAYAKSLRKPS